VRLSSQAVPGPAVDETVVTEDSATLSLGDGEYRRV
jgi:hypothetical protein